MNSTSMTSPNQFTANDGQSNIELGWLSGSDLSTFDWDIQTLLNFSTPDRSPEPEPSFEDLSLQIQSTAETQDYLAEESPQVGSSSLPDNDIVPITILSSTTTNPLDISALENPEHHISVGLESSAATVQNIEV